MACGQSSPFAAHRLVPGCSKTIASLNNGNGTIIFYSEDGTVRETMNYAGGNAATAHQ